MVHPSGANLGGILISNFSKQIDSIFDEIDFSMSTYKSNSIISRINKNEVITILMGDKKVRDGKMRFILPKKIGEVDIYNDIEESQFLKYFD